MTPSTGDRASGIYAALLCGSMLALTVIGCAGPGSGPKSQANVPSEQTLSVALTDSERAQFVASFDQVWETIRTQHWDSELGGLDWTEVREELRPQVEAAQTAREARRPMYEMIRRLEQSHFDIIEGSVYDAIDAVRSKSNDAAEELAESEGRDSPPAGSDVDTVADDTDADEGARVESDESGRTGLEVRVVGDTCVVVRVTNPARAAGISRGWTVTKIGNRSIAEMFEDLQLDDPARTSLYRELSVNSLLDGNAGSTVEIRFDTPKGDQVVSLTRGELLLEPVQTGFLPPMALEVRSETLQSGIGYFGFNVFIDPTELTSRFDEAMNLFIESNAPGVILDVRGNPGGLGIMACGMSGWFFEESGQSLGTMKTRDSELRFVVFPKYETFGGKLAVLIDGSSGSTSEILAGGLQDLGRARVFGLRSAGAALPSRFERLPNGDGFQYAFADYIRTSGARLEGVGVEPDVEIGYDKTVLLQDRDPMIEAAVEWILDEQ